MKKEILKTIENLKQIKSESDLGVWCSQSDNSYDSSLYLSTDEIDLAIEALREKLDRIEGCE